MEPLRRILVSIKDPAHGPTPAARKAAQLARATGARLELFHSITTPMYLDSFADAKGDAVSACTRQLEQLAETLSGEVPQQPLAIAVEASWDYPSYAAIVRRRVIFGADLVVADRHAGPHLARAIMRFTDWELLRSCPAPVLLVGAGNAYQQPVILAALDPAQTWEKPGPLDDQILRLSGIVAQALNGQVHAVHAYESAPVDLYRIYGMDSALCKDLAVRGEKAAASRFALALDSMLICAPRQHLVDGPAEQVILQIAGEIGADVVVLGVVSRSGMNRLLIGSTAERLLDRLSCDLLIVKPTNFVTRIGRANAGTQLVPPPMLPVAPTSPLC